METLNDGPEAFRAFDLFVLTLCDRFLPFEGTRVAFQVPEPMLAATLQAYLQLRDDETLLMIVGGGKKGRPGETCALTTKRISWMGKPSRGGAGEEEDPEGRHPSPWSRSLAYADVPETMGKRAGALLSSIDFGEHGELVLGGKVPLQDALIVFLDEIRPYARGERPIPEPGLAARERADADWPRLVAASDRARALQAEFRSFDRKTKAASRPVVTWLLALACVLVFGAMVATGVSPIQPETAAVIEWGANFGPSIVFDHQSWRLLSSVFLHFGLIHLAMNLWCLLTAGPLVERFFGHFGFAALYLLAGLGGSITSLLVHPTVVGAGASGAIFGIFGGLLGYLAIRRREIPPALLRPMRSGAMAFVGYNVLFGLTSSTIDTAAHLGGLATGLVVGLILTLVAPVGGSVVGMLRRVGTVVVLSAGLWLLGVRGIGVARDRIMADPKVGPLIQSQVNAAPAFNAYQQALCPVLVEFDRMAEVIDRVAHDLDGGNVPVSKIDLTLDRLLTDSILLDQRLKAIPAGNDEIRAMVARLTSARTQQRRMLDALKQFLATGDEARLTGPDGFKASLDAYQKDFADLTALHDAYFKAHHLQPLEKKP